MNIERRDLGPFHPNTFLLVSRDARNIHRDVIDSGRQIRERILAGHQAGSFLDASGFSVLRLHHRSVGYHTPRVENSTRDRTAVTLTKQCGHRHTATQQNSRTHKRQYTTPMI